MHAACVNIPGSFKCRCRDGWVGDGIKCVGEYASAGLEQKPVKWIKERRNLADTFMGIEPTTLTL